MNSEIIVCWNKDFPDLNNLQWHFVYFKRPIPNFKGMEWHFINDLGGVDATLDDITIGDILKSDLPNIFIFQDIHKRILNILNQDWICEHDYSIFEDTLNHLTVKQCEVFYRAFMSEQLDTFAQKYSNLADSGILNIATVYGWLLPYYVDYESFEDELSDLPKLDVNVRPNSHNGYPHPFALHYTHRTLNAMKTVYDSIKSGKGIGHNDVKADMQRLATEIAETVWAKDKDEILRNADVAQITYDVIFSSHPNLQNHLPQKSARIKQWIKHTSPSYGSRKGRISKIQKASQYELSTTITAELTEIK